MIVAKKARPQTTREQLIRKLPGYKQPTIKVEAGPDGEPIAPASPEVKQRDPFLPQLPVMGPKIT